MPHYCLVWPWCRYFESAAAHLNDAYTAASALYDADSVPVARAIHARALLVRDLGDLSEASRLLPQVPRALLMSHLLAVLNVSSHASVSFSVPFAAP